MYPLPHNASNEEICRYGDAEQLRELARTLLDEIDRRDEERRQAELDAELKGERADKKQEFVAFVARRLARVTTKSTKSEALDAALDVKRALANLGIDH